MNLECLRLGSMEPLVGIVGPEWMEEYGMIRLSIGVLTASANTRNGYLTVRGKTVYHTANGLLPSEIVADIDREIASMANVKVSLARLITAAEKILKDAKDAEAKANTKMRHASYRAEHAEGELSRLRTSLAEALATGGE